MGQWEKILKKLSEKKIDIPFSRDDRFSPQVDWSHRRDPPFKLKPTLSSSWRDVVFWWRPSGSVHVRRPPKPLYPWSEDADTGQSQEFGAVIPPPAESLGSY